MKKSHNPRKINQVCTEVLEKISPNEADRKKVEALSNELQQKVVLSAAKRKVEAIVRLEGSVAKDTWLKEEPDIDIFMCMSPAIPRKSLGAVTLEIAREATEGSNQIERFAEHPYLESFVKGYRVNIVPCYRVKKGEWLSATDRTPFHTDYVNKHLNECLRSEVRLLKRFLQGIGAYGAEIKVGGFSGYLCELLIIHFGSFVGTLQAFATYAPRIVIDIEKYYTDRAKELRLLFNEPMVIIDPVDKGRNVASAVKPKKIYTLVAAARTFLKKPAAQFFFPPKINSMPKEMMKQQLQRRGSDYIFLTFTAVNAVPDVLWGQLYRTQRALRKLLEINDFRILRADLWTDEKTLTVYVFELEQRILAKVKKHLGPPLERSGESQKFLSKYGLSNEKIVCGPFIEDGRWVVEIKRNHVDAVNLLIEKLKDGGKGAGVADLISKVVKSGFNVFDKGEILNIYSQNSAFAEFLTDFLCGRPSWLKAEKA